MSEEAERYDESQYEELYEEIIEKELREWEASSANLRNQGGILVIEM